jgi:Fe-S oxidoreductase
LKLASLSRSLTEHLDAISWVAPDCGPAQRVAVHPHCHQRAVRDTASDLRVLTSAGFDVEVLDLGCCGLAGSFGFQSEHDELSRRIAHDRFIPGIVNSAREGPVILDGFSCRLQSQHLTGLPTTSTAEILADRLRGLEK